MKFQMKALGASAAALVAGTITASATVITIEAITEAGTVLTPDAIIQPEVNVGVIGSDPNVYRDPYETLVGLEGVTEYTSVQKDGEAQYKADGDESFNELSLVWGSVDDYNYIDFYNDDVFIATLGGQAVIDAGADDGILGSYVTIRQFFYFDEIRTRSVGENAFEYGGIEAAAVPLPAGILLLGGALAGLGIARRRKS
ncbi:MAG: VPLPA-CTERM sorting domain-containing protein [Pseudomonadota bacterium]